MPRKKITPADEAEKTQLSPEHQEQLESAEKTVMRKIVEGRNYPTKPVKRSVVTLEEVTDILNETTAITAEELEQRISKTKRKTVQKVALAETLLEQNNVITKPLGNFQRAVLEAALSHLAAGNNVVTSDMLYRAMTGRAWTDRASDLQTKTIDDAMEQLMYTKIKIKLDTSKALGANSSGSISGPILPAERVTVTLNGASCSAYRFVTMPIIFRYCIVSNGMVITPLAMLNIPSISYTKRTLSVLNMLTRTIAPILYPVVGFYVKQKPLTISYEQIYETAASEAAGEAVPLEKITQDSTFRKRIRAITKNILDTWVKEGYLSSWSQRKEGKVIIGVEVRFPNKPPELPLKNKDISYLSD